MALHLLSIAKLRNLKAIHNKIGFTPTQISVVINRKTTKFESNSQPAGGSGEVTPGCYQSQNYKIWKQFTTYRTFIDDQPWLLSIAKLQNLKAIHNCLLLFLVLGLVVINHKTTKFESNSQLAVTISSLIAGCYQSQNYEIWKQFTTKRAILRAMMMLLSITKLRNLKAIHKALKPDPWPLNPKSCYQSQNYKIWKQFTKFIK